MKKLVIFLSLVVIFLFFALYIHASEDWRPEFDYLCGKTDEAMTMKMEELKDLVVRCDKLKPVIEASNHPQKKVFLKRLEACKNLFSYMIEGKEQEKAAK